MSIITSNIDKFWQQQTELAKFVLREFDKPYFENIFYNNLDYLNLDADIIPFDVDRWNLNPLMFAYEHYNEQYLYPVVNLVNNIGTIFEFYSDKLNGKIIAPKLEHITALMQKYPNYGITTSRQTELL